MRLGEMALSGAAVIAMGGCADLFNIETVELPPGNGVIAPVQQIVTNRGAGGTNVPITHRFAVGATTSGHAVVIVAVIKTSSYSIDSITDDGGSLWQKVIDGQDSSMAADCRLEVWRAESSNPLAMVDVTLENDRSLALTFIEWPLRGPVHGAEGGLFAQTATPTASVTIGQRALLFAPLAHCGQAVSPTVDDPMFLSLVPVSVNGITAASWYRTAEPGQHTVSWGFAAPLPTVSGLVALGLD